MRKLTLFLLLLVLAAFGWGIYWLVGALATEKLLETWMGDRRAEGWVASAGRLDTRGFPNRFDTTFEALELADPDTQVAWSADMFQMLSLSYKPNHVILVFPGEHRFSTPDQTITINSESMRGSAVASLAALLPIETTTTEVVDGVFSSTQGWVVGLARGQYSMRVNPDAPESNTYDLYVSANGVQLGEGLLAELRRAAKLPEVIQGVTIEARAVFERPWDMRAIEEARPQLRSVALDGLAATWGDLDLKATGGFTVDALGVPTGTIDLQATNWREMVEIARATGALDEAYVGAVTRGLELLAALAGDPETLDVPLTFRRGFSYIGPVPVGPAPDMRLP